MEIALQKATELGVSNIIPLFSERTNFIYSYYVLKNKFIHWNRIILESCRQSNRVSIPYLFFPISLYKWINYIIYLKCNINVTNVILSIDAKNNIRYLKCYKVIIMIIGAEGGFSDKELLFLKFNGFKKIFLGNRILRTETAVLTGITIFQFHFGDI